MSEPMSKFIDSVNQQNYSEAKSEFESIMAQKISDAFETKKVEIAQSMAESTDPYSELKNQLTENLDMDPRKLAKLVDGMATDMVKNNVDAAIKKLDSMIDDNKEKADFLKLIIPNIDVSRDAEKQLKDKMKEYSKG